MSMGKRLNTDSYKKKIKEKHNNNVEVLEEYTSMVKKILHRCNICGREWEGMPCVVLKNENSCQHCFHKKMSLDENKINKIMNDHGLIKVGEYKNYNTKILVKSKICGHEWEPMLGSLLKGCGCPKCAAKKMGDRLRLSIEDCYILADKLGIKCLSTDYISAKKKLVWQCSEGHIFYACYDFMRRLNENNKSKGCRECYHKLRGSSQRLTIEFIKEESKKYGITILEDSYYNCNGKLKAICERGHHYITTWGQIKSNGCQCMQCFREARLLYSPDGLSLVGKNEFYYFSPYIKKIFSRYNVLSQFIVERDAYWPYFIDFVIPELNLAIEYDEREHRFQKNKDGNRQKYIEKQTNFKFIRISDKEFMIEKKSNELEKLLEVMNNDKIPP